MPIIEDDVKNFSRKANAAAIGSSSYEDKHGFAKIIAILSWFFAGIYRMLKHLWSKFVDPLLEILSTLLAFIFVVAAGLGGVTAIFGPFVALVLSAIIVKSNHGNGMAIAHLCVVTKIVFPHICQLY
jgi:hypothetical protein